jgi:hypothetical protein
MSNTKFRGEQAGFRLALVSSLLALTLLLPASAWAGNHTVYVPPPNGVDDTADIQAALDACVAYGPGCTVQFPAGNYLTKQLVAYNFRGNFKGMGRDHTIIAALPYLFVNIEASEPHSLCQPNTTSCFWPGVIIFINGNIEVSDLSVTVPAQPGTATLPWTFEGVTYVGLLDAMTFTGQHVTATVDRIHLEGRLDPMNQYFGYNVINALHFTGEFARSPKPWDWYFVSGSFTVRSSSFSTAYVGISQDGFVQSSHITIGGSPDTGNRIENGYGGIDLETSQDSLFEVSYNQSSGSDAAAWVLPWFPEFVSKSPSQYLIHHNKFIATAQNADAMFLYDDTSNPWIQAAVWNNTAEVQDALSEGIGAYNTKGTAIWNNTVAGTDGNDGIGLWSVADSMVISNNVSGFTVDSTGHAQIYLDPSTTHDLVACVDPSDTVLNQGTQNTVIGCQQSAAMTESATRSAVPAASVGKAGVPKRKPWLR